MFLNPSRLKTQGAFAAVGAIALIACGDPEARTDLRPEGDPEVLAVLVLNDSVSGLYEAATYCAVGDEKRPGLVGLPDFTTQQICPDNLSEPAPMVADASPDTFYVRIMFDELLDPNIEDLIEVLDDDGQPTGTFEGSLARTQPVTLKCTGVDNALHDVPYDGYYSPSGNKVTWPLGPSLVIKQTGEFVIPTNANCEVTLKDNITDKNGNPVPAEQRGPFKFKVSGIKPLVIDPADEAEVTVQQLYGDNFYIQLNTEVTGASGVGQTAWCTSFTASQFSGCASDVDIAMTPQPTLCALDGAVCGGEPNLQCGANTCDTVAGECVVDAEPCATNADCAANTCEPAPLYAYSLFPFGLTRLEWGFGPFGYPETEKMYTFEIKEGAMLADRCGAITTFGPPSVENNTKVTVTTAKFAYATTGTFVPNQGDTVPANRKISISFNAPIKHTPAFTPDVDPASFVVEPQPFANATTPITNALMVRYPPTGAENVVFLRGHYQPNTEYKYTIKAGTVFRDNYNKMVVQDTDKVITFKTQPIATPASPPAHAATVTKATPASATNITFSFNQSMDVTTFGPDDIEFTGTPTNLTFGTGSSATSTTPNCTISSQQCLLRVSGTFTPGEYTVKLKAGAMIKDVLGNDYMQPTDRVIKFTVKEATPAPVIPCLGA